jgi:hypothetical protein
MKVAVTVLMQKPTDFGKNTSILLDSSFVCDRLNCVFEKDTYMRTRESAENPADYIILIHEIHTANDNCTSKSAHLVVTKYSFLRDEPIFQYVNSNGDGRAETGFNELLLRFSDYTSMGTRFDVEVVEIDDIVQAQVLPIDLEVVYGTRPQGKMIFSKVG